MWKVYGKQKFPQSFERIAQNLRKSKVSIKFPRQKIRWNFGILHSERAPNGYIHCVKSVRTQRFPDPHFFRSLQSKSWKIRTRKTLNADTFSAVIPYFCTFRDSFQKTSNYRATYVGSFYISSHLNYRILTPTLVKKISKLNLKQCKYTTRLP